MESYTNIIRMMADDIDKVSSRGARFVRATEIKPFTKEIRKPLVEACRYMLDQITILHKMPFTVDERVEVVKRFFTTLMEYPEFLTSFPKFRFVTENKAKELSQELSHLNLPQLEILQDYMFYLNMLKARSDYVEYNIFIHGFINKPTEPLINITLPVVEIVNKWKNTLPVVEPKKHSYNLRIRKTKN